MNKCKECPRKIPSDSKYCRYHSAKYASNRVSKAEMIGKGVMTIGPIIVMILTRGKVRPR